MPRVVEHEVVVDTSAFSAVQLQPHVVASLTWNALARWLRAYLVSFPELIRRERTGFVVLGFHLEYADSAGFFDGDSLGVRAALRVGAAGARALLDVRIGAGGRRAAQARLVLCPVAIEDPVSLGAQPAPLAEHLLGRLQADEIDAGAPPRLVSERRALFELGGTPLGESELPFMVHRHRCEVAEQWSWTAVPALVEEARERLALAAGARAELRATLGEPMRHFDVEFGKPFFAFDRGRLVTRAFACRGRVGLVHRLVDEDGGALHATVVEAF